MGEGRAQAQRVRSNRAARMPPAATCIWMKNIDRTELETVVEQLPHGRQGGRPAIARHRFDRQLAHLPHGQATERVRIILGHVNTLTDPTDTE
jgi:hypothetical protein